MNYFEGSSPASALPEGLLFEDQGIDLDLLGNSEKLHHLSIAELDLVLGQIDLLLGYRDLAFRVRQVLMQGRSDILLVMSEKFGPDSDDFYVEE